VGAGAQDGDVYSRHMRSSRVVDPASADTLT
jgi:hypothetical protein